MSTDGPWMGDAWPQATKETPELEPTHSTVRPCTSIPNETLEELLIQSCLKLTTIDSLKADFGSLFGGLFSRESVE